MPSLKTLAPRDQARQFAVKFENDAGEREYIQVEYYRNRISLAPMEAMISEEDADELDESQLDAIRAASTMCYYLKSWDLEGPLEDYQGREIVPAGEVIPLDPRITQFVPTPIVGEVMRQLTEEVFPNRTASRRERRRSR